MSCVVLGWEAFNWRKNLATYYVYHDSCGHNVYFNRAKLFLVISEVTNGDRPYYDIQKIRRGLTTPATRTPTRRRRVRRK